MSRQSQRRSSVSRSVQIFAKIRHTFFYIHLYFLHFRIIIRESAVKLWSINFFTVCLSFCKPWTKVKANTILLLSTLIGEKLLKSYPILQNAAGTFKQFSDSTIVGADLVCDALAPLLLSSS
jgi:hypothetical protein